MAEVLKDRLNDASLREFALAIQSVYKGFQVNAFLESTMDETWDDLELMARGRQVSLNLGKYLPTDYMTAIGILDEVIMKYDGFAKHCFPDFIEVFGQDESHWDISISALARYTPYASSEFAVRPFILNHEKRMMAQMYAWSRHENEHVRRLSSEGCRPQLPWGRQIASFKKDPAPVLPILEQLKDDPSLFVRRSVANNLNDISKTHPDLVARLAKDWFGKSEHTDWVVKHGCRTLCKKGHSEVLAIFGYQDDVVLDIADFALERPSVSLGEDIVFSFSVMAKETTKVRLEYGIDYVKANGKRNRKVFKISEVSLKENRKKVYTKSHSFADVTTRRHYPGIHSISLLVNGVERGKLDFELII
ncbi:MAG: DNA alkylation repair protein [Peptococcaceae bacterium]|nr:DNA alkylation repair protein [Peptococcaceae bacterium]